LINKLLEKDPAKRLGTKGSSQEIMAHKWFADIDVAQLEALKVEPPHNFANTDGTINKELYDVKTNKSALELSEVPAEKQEEVKQKKNEFAKFTKY